MKKPKKMPRGRPARPDHMARIREKARLRNTTAPLKFDIPERGLDPLMRRLIEEQKTQRRTDQAVSDRLGNSRSAVMRWRKGEQPKVGDFVAYANVLGFDVVLVPREARNA